LDIFRKEKICSLQGQGKREKILKEKKQKKIPITLEIHNLAVVSQLTTLKLELKCALENVAKPTKLMELLYMEKLDIRFFVILAPQNFGNKIPCVPFVGELYRK
jgi:hypothetical protein